MTDPRIETHNRWDGDAAAYALHALEENEARAFEEHLTGCKRCQEELASFREAVAGLPPMTVPEPSSLALLFAGTAAAVRSGTRRREKR